MSDRTVDLITIMVGVAWGVLRLTGYDLGVGGWALWVVDVGTGFGFLWASVRFIRRNHESGYRSSEGDTRL